ncbi:PhzF family phenazine biosynthesis protein [Nocardioides sp.]|uniref:PhzF family phenazine biosynthesis protein n=1 Tax=Nocardioides sp. TaxID=35761 RepID=UPI0027359902|nr:PhzF family phenazine biosynthesis protein [Nocardioides sp.]MDP3894343.1 PhzF family phenazine biosynthesis protein [Nocardioides sp.]
MRPGLLDSIAVVTHADDLDEERMAAIDVEFNLSETTFVSRPTPGGDEVSGVGRPGGGAGGR